jgi:tripartite ATP-independent transporter DctM subunit
MARQAFGGFAAIGRAFLHCFFAIMTPVVILGGMFSGWFTPTEAAAVACLYALFLGFVVYRTLHWKQLGPILVDTAMTTGVVMVLVMAAAALGWCISISRVPQTFTPLILATITSPLVFLLLVNVLLLVVGCFMEALAAMLVLIPILVPPAIALGIDPLQFGLVFVLNLMIGTITPPVGVVLYVTAKVADVPFENLVKAVLPYLVPLVAVLALITLWPPLTTWLPKLLLGR